MDYVARTAFGDRAWQAIQTIAMVVVAVGVIGIGIGSLLQPRETTIPAASVPPISESPSAAGSAVQADSEDATPASAWSAEEQAILAVLIGYNAAETEVGATLDAAPLMPYLDPDGPLAARRIASLAERRARNAPHVTMLQRWGIGAITVNGDTATVTTQETWSNQEQGEPSPRIATVRVVYTLRRSATHGWQITDSSDGVYRPRCSSMKAWAASSEENSMYVAGSSTSSPAPLTVLPDSNSLAARESAGTATISHSHALSHLPPYVGILINHLLSIYNLSFLITHTSFTAAPAAGSQIASP